MKKTAIFVVLIFLTINIAFAQPLSSPKNLREHLSLLTTGKIDTNYLMPDSSSFVSFNWNIVSENFAYKTPPTGAITYYTMDLVKTDSCDWLIELSHEYQYDSKRLIITYFDGIKYNTPEIPYDELFSLAKSKGYEKYLIFFNVTQNFPPESEFSPYLKKEPKIRIYCKSNNSQPELILGFIILKNKEYLIEYIK